MLRPTFPQEDAAWKVEVERLLANHSVDLRRIEQLAGPAQTAGVVIGGNPPTHALCMQFAFDIALAAAECMGCDGDECKVVNVPSDIKNGSEVLFAAGNYTLSRRAPQSECLWEFGSPSDPQYIHYRATSLSGVVAVTFQSSAGSLYYGGTATDPPGTSCSTADAGTGSDPDYTEFPSSITMTGGSGCGGETADCDELHVQAEIKWNEGQFKWLQSYFAINGDEGGGSVTATFNGATFTLAFAIDHFCYSGNATFHAPAYIDDLCRPTIARRATAAAGWPTSVSGRCVDCTPTTTSTTTSSSSTTGTTSTTTGSSSTTGTTSTTTTETSSTSSTTTLCAPNGCTWEWNGSSWDLVSNECVVPCAACDTPPGFSGSTIGETATTACEIAL